MKETVNNRRQRVGEWKKVYAKLLDIHTLMAKESISTYFIDRSLENLKKQIDDEERAIEHLN